LSRKFPYVIHEKVSPAERGFRKLYRMGVAFAPAASAEDGLSCIRNHVALTVHLQGGNKGEWEPAGFSAGDAAEFEALLTHVANGTPPERPLAKLFLPHDPPRMLRTSSVERLNAILDRCFVEPKKKP
jgi:hypothetical protein